MLVSNSTTNVPSASVIIQGASGVGKTCLLGRFVKQNFTETHRSTVDPDLMSKALLIDNQIVKIEFWDTAGEERFIDALGPLYFRRADCCILAFDVTREETFEKITFWKEQALKQANPIDPEHFPFVLLGNKIDMFHERTVRPNTAEAWCEENNKTPYFEVSANDGTNVDKAFETIARCALARKERMNSQASSDSKTLRLDDQTAAQQEQKGICSKCSVA